MLLLACFTLYIRVFVCPCRGQRRALSIFLYCFLSYASRQDLSVNWKFADGHPARLTSHCAPGIQLSLPPSTGSTGTVNYTQISKLVLGVQTQVLMHPLSHLSNPSVDFFFVCLFEERVSWRSGLPHTPYAVKDDFWTCDSPVSISR